MSKSRYSKTKAAGEAREQTARSASGTTYSKIIFNLKYVSTSYLPLLSALRNCRFFAGTMFGFWLNCFPYLFIPTAFPGKGESAIQAYESGKSDIPLSALISIMGALKISFADLERGSKTEPALCGYLAE